MAPYICRHFECSWRKEYNFRENWCLSAQRNIGGWYLTPNIRVGMGRYMYSWAFEDKWWWLDILRVFNATCDIGCLPMPKPLYARIWIASCHESIGSLPSVHGSPRRCTADLQVRYFAARWGAAIVSQYTRCDPLQCTIEPSIWSL